MPAFSIVRELNTMVHRRGKGLLSLELIPADVAICLAAARPSGSQCEATVVATVTRISPRRLDNHRRRTNSRVRVQQSADDSIAVNPNREHSTHRVSLFSAL